MVPKTVADQFLFAMDPRFPREDVEEIGRRLTGSAALVPGWIPPEVGFLDIRALLVSEHVDGFEHVILPDRNIASRMARIARSGVCEPRDPATEVAVQLMAFAQATNIDIDPGVAFRELAHHSGGDDALGELTWFRTADTSNVLDWIDLALGRIDRVDLGAQAPVEDHDVSEPPSRWQRNYVAALKIYELEVAGGSPIKRIETLLDWMIDDFILAGPAFLYAARAFATHNRRSGMMKGIKSADRSRALDGAKNAAWDITYLSEFVRRVQLSETEGRRFILATADRALADIASAALLGLEASDDLPSLDQRLAEWWHPRDARRIARRYFDCVEKISDRAPPGANLGEDPIPAFIANGEKRVMAWRPGNF